MRSSKPKLSIYLKAPLGLRLGSVFIFLLALGMIVSVRPVGADSSASTGQPAPRFVPLPVVTVSTGSVMLGDDFTINATFANNGSETGYGPFIDLYIPHVGPDGIYPDELTYDGISPASGASYTATLGAEILTVVTQTFPDDGSGTGCVKHPWALDNVGFFLDVCGTAGDQLVSIQLPYGSYTPGQPALNISIPAHLSENANLGDTLSIRARAGFIYGRTPMVDWCCTTPTDTTIVSDGGTPDTWVPFSDVIPTVVDFSKSTNAGELATGPNNPATYTLLVDVAEGQTFSNIDITDDLPNSIVYLGNLTVNPAATTVSAPPVGGPYNGAQILLHWDGPVVSDITVAFDYYVPELDANGQPIAPGSTTNAATLDAITWIPSDGSPPLDVSSGVGPGVADHSDRPITLGKGSTVVVDPTSNGATPGDIVRYTLTFEISDYFGYANLSLEDILSDGQHYFQNATYYPQLSITRDGGTQTYAFAPGNVDVACNYTDTGFGGECDSHDYTNSSPPDNDGGTTVTFDIAQELIAQVGNDFILGDLVDDGGSSANATTTGTVTFYAIVQDTYTDTYPGESVKMGDALNDSATISGNQIDPASCNPGPCTITATVSGESASAGISVGRGTLEKTIVARNGTVCNPATFDPCTSVQVAAGDAITYRITYELLTGDFANLSLTDFLPLPIFHADDPNVDGSSLGTWPKYVGAAVIPDPGSWMLGPDDTRGIDPNPVTISSHLNDNSVKFEFGSYDDPANLPKTIDLLFTVRVTTEKFGDGLKMRNSVLQQDANSPGSVSTTNNFIDLTLTEPILVGEKTVVSTDHVGVEPNPPVAPPVIFEIPGGSGIPWNSGTTPINSDYLDANPLGSGIGGIDGGDMVKFAIVIENTGSGINGAFDITLKDVLPDGYIFPGIGLGGFNLQAHRGDGKALDDGTGSGFEFLGPNGNATDFFGNGIRLRDPADNPAFAPSDPEYGQGLCQLHEATSGKNVIIVTYDLMVDPDIAPGAMLQNEGQVTSYSGSEGGDPYIPEPITDTADSEIGNPTLLKELVGTEIDNSGTTNTNNRTQVVIGELVTYRLTVTVPEGLSPNTQIVDTLDAELAFVSQDSFTNSNSADVTISGSTTPTITNNGGTITWNLGTVENNNVDNDVPETLTFEYTAVVLNVSVNQSGSARNNSVRMTWDTKDADGNTVTGSQGPVSAENVTVIEPVLNIAKAANPTTGDAGNPVEFTLTITHDATSETDAYDVTLSDPLPLCAVGGPSAIDNPAISSVTDSAGLVTTADFELSGDNATGWTLQSPAGGSFDVPLDAGRSIEIRVSGTLAYCVTPTQVLTNTSTIYWTSLDGDIVDRSNENTTDSDERTGADGVGGALNDYADNANAIVTVNATQLQKYLVATSETHTGVNGLGRTLVTIGEIVRYRLVVTLPEGTSDNFQIDDNLPGGLGYLDDGAARIAFISNGAGIVSSEVGSLPVPAIPVGCNVAGNDLSVLPDPLPCVLADYNVGSTTSINSNTDNYSSGVDPQFKLGQMVNNDNDGDSEFVVVEFNALVMNASTASNDSGELRRNNFRVTTPSGYTSNSNNIDVYVAEPSITNLAKNANPVSGDAGDTITYTLTFSNANGNYTSTAYDVILTDTIHPDMTANLSGMTVDTACATGVDTSNSSGNSLDVRFASVPVGCSVTITYTATLNGTVTADQVLDNTADLTYTSLPGDTGTTSNATGSSVTDVSGGNNGERNGTGANPPNDYADTASAQVIANALDLVKSLVDSSNGDTLGNDLTIGEIVTYRLATVIPEGTSLAFTVYDTLPAGFTYAGDPRLSFVATDAMTVDADLAGADNDALPPTFTIPAARITEAGQNLTFTLGDLINNDRDNADAEYVVIEFDVLVNDSADNNNTDLDNNEYTVSIDGNTKGPSNQVGTRIVEPFLNIAKSADDNTWIYGQTVEYTLDITHISGSADPADDSNAVAYDIVVTDTIPTGLTFNAVTSLPAGWTQSFSAPTLTFSCLTSNGCSFAPTDAAPSITFTVTVDSPPTATALIGTDIATNNVAMNWTSLPGVNTNERTGAGGVDDYNVSASHEGGLEYYALGNRVWFDTNNNSQIDAGEVGVDGVAVELYAADLSGAPTGSVLSTDTTANGGYYLFDYLDAGDYVVILPGSNLTGTGPLVGYWSSGTTLAADGTIGEAAAPDPDNDVDSDDNGAFTGGRILSNAVTLGPNGLTEPTGETDLDGGSNGEQPNGRANMTVDFGFYRTSVGDQVFYDENFTGNFESGTDTPASGITVQLYSSNGTEINAGLDGVLGTADDAAGGMTTNASGQYLFSSLPQGDYIVRVTAPVNTASTIDSDNPADTTSPDTNDDNNDNGIGTSGGTVSSGAFSLTPGSSGVLNNTIVTHASGETYNPTVDFGFVNLYALGNRVWFDTDNSSDINGGEVGVDGVTVQLFSSDGSTEIPVGADGILGTADDSPGGMLTADGGYYLFDNLYPGDYLVVIPAANFGTGAVLEGYRSSATYMNADGTLGETAAPDPDLGPDSAAGGGDDDLDSDDNGTLQTSGAFSGAVTSLPVTLGPVGLTEPTDDTDEQAGVGQGLQPDGRANLSVDFGFYRTEIGNLVFGDVNKNGNYESATDTLYSGVTVQLYSSNGTEINVGPDGMLGTGDDAAGGVITDADGLYLFSGLPAGDYIVRVVAPTGTVSTIDSYDLDDNTTAGPNVNTDNNDNGQGTSDGVVNSGTLTMTPGSAGAQGNNSVSNATGTTTNPTIDFGFTTVYALGNRVWFDTNNNSVIDNGEVGVDGVTVHLYAASDLTTILSFDTTANGGYYLFDYLEDGDYVVVIPGTNFGSGAVLEGYWSSATTMNADGTTGETAAPGPNNDLDSDDNGTLQDAGAFNGAVISSSVTLGPGMLEPIAETDLEAGVGQGDQPDNQANMTVDFGFYTIELGNLVWDDMDNSGTVNGAETGISGVDVQLWSADGSQLLDTDTTDANGIYTFTGLSQGDYLLRIPAAEFEGAGTLRDYVSSTGAAPGYPYEPAPDADLNTTDSDDNGNTVGGTLGLGGYIQSEPVTLTPILEQSYDNVSGSTTEFRVDFGVYLFRQADTSITKDDGQNFYLQGDVLTYTVVVSNDGPSDVTGAQVSDPRPSQVASWAWACTGATGGASGCDGVADASSDFVDTVDLPANSSITYTVTANVDAAATGDLVNTATVTVPAGYTEIDTTNTSSTDTDTIAALTIIKDDGVEVAAPGYVLTYSLLIENTGNADLVDITVTDTLPDDVTYQSASLPPNSVSAGVLVWNGISIAAGGSYSIDVQVRVNDTPANPVITNLVQVTDVDTSATSSDTDIDTIAVLNEKTIVTTNINNDTNQQVLIGEVVTYQISLTIPNGTLLDLQALDVLDEGLAFDECLGVSVSDPTVVTTTLAGGFADACPAAASDPRVTDSGHNVVFDFGDVTNASAVDQIIIVQYTVDVLDIASNVDGVTGINNFVTWTWNGGTREASAPPLEILEPDMSILKDATPSVALPGSIITFTIDIEHTDISTADAYDVVVTDQLPAGLAYVGNVVVTGLSYDRFNYDTGTSTITFEWDVFPLLATSSITFQATFVGPPPVVNEASVAWTSIPLDPGVQSNYNLNSTERFYDPLDPAGVNSYGASSSVTIYRPALPKTGFAPGRVTTLPAQPGEKEYRQLDALALEIPRLNVKLPIVGVPTSAQGWDLTWLSNQAGWLEGTAYPTLAGNTGITAHTYLADGTPGPFVNLGSLYWGDKVYIYANGNKYTYEVREVRLLWPEDVSVLRHEEYDWITLITCREYNEKKDDYTYRVAVRAVLVNVEAGQ